MLTKTSDLNPIQVLVKHYADGSSTPYEAILPGDKNYPFIICETEKVEDQTIYTVYLNHKLETLVYSWGLWYILGQECTKEDFVHSDSAPAPQNRSHEPSYDELARLIYEQLKAVPPTLKVRVKKSSGPSFT